MGLVDPSVRERKHAVLALWVLSALAVAVFGLVDIRTGLIDVWSFDSLFQLTGLFVSLVGATIAVSRQSV